MFRNLKVIFLLIFIASGCATEQQQTEWTFEVQPRPFEIQLSQPGAEGEISLTGGNKSAMFYITGQDTHYVGELNEV